MLLHDDGDGAAYVELDYVSPRFRDFSPGEFVWRRSGMLRDHGFARVVTSADDGRRRTTSGSASARAGDSWALDLEAG